MILTGSRTNICNMRLTKQNIIWVRKYCNENNEWSVSIMSSLNEDVEIIFETEQQAEEIDNKLKEWLFH
jgi:hypothetical protein